MYYSLTSFFFITPESVTILTIYIPFGNELTAIFSFLEMLKKNINNPQLSEDASIALIETWENEIQLYFKEYNELPNS